MGNPDHIKPTDIVHLYFDDYKGQDATDVSEADVRELKELINAANAHPIES